MRWSMRTGPKCVDAPAGADPVGPRPTRAECSDFVVLARRMSIPADHAIRQYVDVSLSLAEAERQAQRS